MLIAFINFILLLCLGIPVAYFAVFSFAALLCRRRSPVAGDGGGHSFVILIPAYKSDSSILDTALAAAAQDLPEDRFRVLVISDSMRPQTVESLRNEGVEVLEVTFTNSTKAKSLLAATEYLGPGAAEAVVILDADNIVSPQFLRDIDGAWRPGTAIQAHRTAKNRDSSVAVIDAVSEEINNSIFRKGHNALGLSSALIGSGMVFDYGWFHANASSFTTSGEDKEMELKLLQDGIKVEYLESVKVLDEKTRTQSNYYNQHRRWTASQYNLFPDALKKMKDAADKIGYFDKLLQWTFPSRMIILAGVPLVAIMFSLARSGYAILWWALTLVMAASMLAGVPREQRDRKLAASLVKVPALAMTAVANLFRIKGTKDKFIHTEHK